MKILYKPIMEKQILKVDVQYPEKLHNDLPFSLERMKSLELIYMIKLKRRNLKKVLTHGLILEKACLKLFLDMNT